MEFVEAPLFTQLLADYLSDDEYRALQFFLARDPEAGDVIPATGGFRKVCWADRRRGKGKRGGLRVVYYYLNMAKNGKKTERTQRRSLFRELMSGVEAMREHREGRLTLRTAEVAPITIPPVDPDLDTLDRLKSIGAPS